MTTYLEFYEENLYPFQNSILKTVGKLSLPFYLTGGTAISRFYYHHRYSDDLDFFVNSEENFPDYVAKALSAIKEMSDVEINQEELQVYPDWLTERT